MLNSLRNMFSTKEPVALPAVAAAVPPGTRYYVIGDIHGRLDLYRALIEAIENDDASAPAAQSHVVLLGDLVDRGPDSAGVIDWTRAWQAERSVRVLAGNHEEMFLHSFEKPEALRHFLKHGGRETVLSYGMDRKAFLTATLEELFEALPRIVPIEDREYLASFEEYIVAGDYLFVHAGIDPERPLEEQKRSDMLWIRDRFLNWEEPLDKVVVHGHTIYDDVADCGNRIGIDTGAFRSGVLTALVLEGARRRTIQAVARDDGTIRIETA